MGRDYRPGSRQRIERGCPSGSLSQTAETEHGRSPRLLPLWILHPFWNKYRTLCLCAGRVPAISSKIDPVPRLGSLAVNQDSFGIFFSRSGLTLEEAEHALDTSTRHIRRYLKGQAPVPRLVHEKMEQLANQRTLPRPASSGAAKQFQSRPRYREAPRPPNRSDRDCLAGTDSSSACAFRSAQ